MTNGPASHKAQEGGFVRAIKHAVRRHALHQQWLRKRQERTLATWLRGPGGGPAPPLLKQYIVREYGRRFRAATLVESGTFLGEMAEAMACSFDHVYSIELDPALHRRAVARLSHLKNVTLLHGDSGDLLPAVIQALETPCVYWLDGHYSGGDTARGREDSPVRRELEHIVSSGRCGDVVLIDDARLFDGRNGYPSTTIAVDLLQRRLHAVVSIAEDIIRATPGWP